MTLLLCTQCGIDLVPGQRFCAQCGTPTPAPLVDAPVPADGPWEAILGKLRSAVVPKYQVRRLLGQGGMAGVYLADEPKLGRRVAIKVMAPGLMVDPKLVERFAQEARTIAQLRHANIVTVYEVDERDGLHYFSMDYVPGRTLGQVMSEAAGPLSVHVIQAWLYQVSDALAYAHARGVVHRDIKPGNVLLDQQGNALVTDFGIAKVTEGGQGGLTRTGMLVGTPAYMSPEQCAGESVTGASDQYALGAVAYQMLTGRAPFTGPTMSVLHAHMNQPPRPIGELRPDCPERLQDAVMRMLAKRPEERFPSMSAVISSAGASPPGFDDPVRLRIVTLAKPAAALTIGNAPASLVEGTQLALEVVVADAAGEPLSDRKVDWRSDDEHVAAVVSGPTLIGLGGGTARINATCGSARATVELVVESDPITALRIVPESFEIAPGDVQPVAAEGRKPDGAFVPRAALWTSSDPQVARVEADGTIRAVGVGSAVIAASTGGRVAEATVSIGEAVAPLPPMRLDDEPAGPVAQVTPLPDETTPPPAWRPSYAEADLVDDEPLVTPVPIGPTEEPPAAESPATPTPIPAGGPAAEIAGAEAGAPGRRSGKRLIAAAATLALVGSLVVFQAVRSGGSPPPPPPPEPAFLEITGALPLGAVVEVRDEQGTSTPIEGGSLSLAAGPYTVEARAEGHQPWTETVRLEPGERRSIAPLLLPIEATADAAPGTEPGTLRIAGTLPAGATVTLSGPGGASQRMTGRTASVQPGRYAVRVEARGFQPWSGRVEVVAGQTLSVTPSLQPAPATGEPIPAPPQPGRLQIGGTLPPGAAVTVRDAQGNQIPLSDRSTSVSPGSYTVQVTARDHEPWSATVQIGAGQNRTVTPELQRRPVTPPPSPQRDPEADQRSIRAEIQAFAAAFDRRDGAAVVGLLPAEQRDTWRGLLGRREVTDFSAELQGVAEAHLDGDSATVPVDLAIAFLSGNQRVRQTLQWTAVLARSGDGWRLTGLRER